jgi:tetratricopeptide (TPR) repeat protein
MIWVDYRDSGQPQFDDTPEYYSREVMAEKVPSGKFADNNIGAEGSGRIQARDEISDVKQNAALPNTYRAAGERRGDSAAKVTTNIEVLPQAQMRSGDDEYFRELEKKGESALSAGQYDVGVSEKSFNGIEDYEAESTKHGQSSASREEILAELKNEQPSKGQFRIAGTDDLVGGEQEKAMPQVGASDNKKDDDGFRFSLGSSKVMAKKVHKPSGDMELDSVVEDNKELVDKEGLDYAASAKISEQVRSAEKESQISKNKLEDGRLIAIDSPQEISDKTSLRELNVALSQQKAGDCESAIITNENNLKNSPKATIEIKEQTYLSLAQCYEKQNMFVKAIENYNYLQQVAPAQKSFATEKIQELNFKVQNLNYPATLSEPSKSTETDIEVTK